MNKKYNHHGQKHCCRRQKLVLYTFPAIWHVYILFTSGMSALNFRWLFKQANEVTKDRQREGG